MKKQRDKRTLRLTAETLRRLTLTRDQLAGVAGGRLTTESASEQSNSTIRSQNG
jgi:hypothetical protein